MPVNFRRDKAVREIERAARREAKVIRRQQREAERIDAHRGHVIPEGSPYADEPEQ